MNYEQLADEFIKAHEGVGYQSNPQMVAIRAFAKWLSAQQAVVADQLPSAPMDSSFSFWDNPTDNVYDDSAGG